MKYQSRADLLIAAGESIKMQTAAGIEPVFKSMCGIVKMGDANFTLQPDHYEFPLAVVEGKPVFCGDELYDDGEFFVATSQMKNACWDDCSWNPPKPATVMVELLREDAKRLSNYLITIDGIKIGEACRKALEKA